MNKLTFLISLSTLCAAFIATPAHAQFGSAFAPTSFSQEGLIRPRRTTVNYFFTPFYGRNDKTRDQRTLNGTLLAVEHGLLGSGQSSYKVGGWVFKDGPAYICEGHFKAYISPQWGVQAGLLGAQSRRARTKTPDVDAFVLYNYFGGGREADGQRSQPYAIQVGLGGYHYGEVPANRTKWKTKLSGFVQGSTEFARYISADASAWYITSPDGKQIRYAAGLGYRF